jgi:hypothetical protein
MSNQIFLAPARPGLIVRDPETGKPLDAAGEYKPVNPYWKRRLAGGDVIAAKSPDKINTPARKDKDK